MPKIKFTRSYVVKGAGGESYKEGQTVDVSEQSARHFLNRGAAELVEEGAKPEPMKSEPPKPAPQPEPSRQVPDPAKSGAKPRGK